jgi:hypothetical protein
MLIGIILSNYGIVKKETFSVLLCIFSTITIYGNKIFLFALPKKQYHNFMVLYFNKKSEPCSALPYNGIYFSNAKLWY